LAAYATKGRAEGFLHNPVIFERALFPLILLRKINGNSARSELSFAAEGGGILFTQTPYL
jgi:hypothetical protein